MHPGNVWFSMVGADLTWTILHAEGRALDGLAKKTLNRRVDCRKTDLVQMSQSALQLSRTPGRGKGG